MTDSKAWDWENAEKDACRIEHVISQEAISCITRALVEKKKIDKAE